MPFQECVLKKKKEINRLDRVEQGKGAFVNVYFLKFLQVQLLDLPATAVGFIRSVMLCQANKQPRAKLNKS